MKFRLFGGVELIADGKPVDLGSTKQRLVLAALLISAPHPVPVDVVVDRVWGAEPPREVRTALYSYVARLRRVLATADPRLQVSRTAGGYAVVVDPGAVDVLRFRKLADRARAISESDPAHAYQLLRQAIDLTHGTPLAGLRGDWAARTRDHLTQQRLDAMTQLASIALRLGRHTELVDELSGWVAEHPLAEPLAACLMRALYAAGRTAEALEWYARTRERLADLLGTEPGPELRQLHQRMLRQDPALISAASASEPERPRLVPRQLPAPPRVFVGRGPELDRLCAELTRPPGHGCPVIAVSGPGGVGKSTLACYVAHHLAEHFPDGQLYADLQGATPGMTPLRPVEVLGRFLRALGVPAASVPDDPCEAAAQFRTLTADRRILVVLDNAADATQVRPLLPTGCGCAALITSRRMLTTVDGASHLPLGLLHPDEAVSLLSGLDPQRRATTDPWTAAELSALCGHLPLALRIAGARLASRPEWPLSAFTDRLANERRRLDELRFADLAVRSCFDITYQELERTAPDAARAFRLLAVLDGPDVSVPIAARLFGTSDDDAATVLDGLADIHLVETRAPGRYRMHDLIRLYAAELADATESPKARREAQRRAWRCYVATAQEAYRLVRAGNRQYAPIDPAESVPLADATAAMAWVEAEHANLLAAARQAAATADDSGKPNNPGGEHADLESGDSGDCSQVTIQLGLALHWFLYAGAYWSDATELAELALRAAERRGELYPAARLWSDLAGIASQQGRRDLARARLERALAIDRRAGNRVGEAASLANIGVLYTEAGDYPKAIEHIQKAIEIHRAELAPGDLPHLLNNLADTLIKAGEPHRALSPLQEATALVEKTNNRSAEAYVYVTLGVASLELGGVDAAIKHLKRGAHCHREVGNRGCFADALGWLGEAHRRAGDLVEAERLCLQALYTCQAVGIPVFEAGVHTRLGDTLHDAGKDAEARRHWSAALRLYQQLDAPEAEHVRARLGTEAVTT